MLFRQRDNLFFTCFNLTDLHLNCETSFLHTSVLRRTWYAVRPAQSLPPGALRHYPYPDLLIATRGPLSAFLPYPTQLHPQYVA